MAQVSLEPYLFFKGNCREAMEFYKSVFGGELSLNTISEAPAGTPTMPGGKPEDIMHAALKGGAVNLMACDSTNASDKMAKVSLSLGGTDEDELRQIFDKLADGGKVNMPLEKMFWGDVFGSVSDKYGVDWQVNIGTHMA